MEKSQFEELKEEVADLKATQKKIAKILYHHLTGSRHTVTKALKDALDEIWSPLR